MGTVPPDPSRSTRFEALFAACYEPVQRYVLRRARPADADEVVAETFLTVWRRLDDVPADAALAWCYGVARRTLANQRRGDQRRRALTERVAASAPMSTLQAHDTSGPDPALDEALLLLDPDERELLRLWAWEDLAPREIAVVLGITANAASIRLHRAKRSLAEALQRKDHDEAGHMLHGTPGKEGTP